MTEVAQSEFYTMCYKRLLYSTHIVRRDTGKEIKIPMGIETLYGYMHDQYDSYTKKGCDFFESLESIGRKFKGSDRRTVKKMIDVLNALGLVISVKQKQKEHGYDRYHHTVLEFTEIAKNLSFYGPEKISGGSLADGMHIRALEKKKPRGKPKTPKSALPKTEEKYNVKPEQREQTNEHTEPTKIVIGERKPVSPMVGCDDVDISRADVQVSSGSNDDQPFPPKNHPAEVTIFDQDGVITEAYINNSYTRSDIQPPDRNEDGTLSSFCYIYWIAKSEQDCRDGSPIKTPEEYMAEAKPEYIPPHLLDQKFRGATDKYVPRMDFDEPEPEFEGEQSFF
ncbi:TPA: hypothetical protein ACHW2M_002801 [Yersinia enterocolitica]|uniref:DUF6945 domain-containing protein n=1 Tax=Yersinia enterocolitica TaxID=630 RepID=UPI001F589FC9|nr:hypothetical protein [Yersinia enterocolitica]EKN3827535.1 hypothetical protein [Yersinia enterocolitica]EKN4825691.1 hypothetical protein [Yersinia enterocolitica]EKN5141967.1 hypothetical protein [Yersinia enterocolitica]ELW8139138.1 hypothetical protein [Yersinia enterocolitica]ELW8952840.1 hypothetical protein [Yersinia enterocolitica]